MLNAFFRKKLNKLDSPKNGVSVAFTLGVVVLLYYFYKISSAILFNLYLFVFSKNSAELSVIFKGSVFLQFFHIAILEFGIMAILVLVMKYKKISLKSVGLGTWPKFGDLGWALVGFGGYFPVSLLASFIATKLSPALNQPQAIGFAGASGYGLILVFIALAVLPPIAEELVFRGFLYSSLRVKLGVPVAALITSLLFAVAHLGGGAAGTVLWIAAIDTFVLSIFLIAIRQASGRLWPAIFLHALKNGIAFLFLFRGGLG